MDTGEKSTHRTVQSLERGFAIMAAIAASSEPLSLAEISKMVGLHTSTAFHLLRTLSILGCVKQDAERRYRIGSLIYTLAASAQTEGNLVNDAAAELEWLARTTGETSHIAIMSNHQVFILGKAQGSSPVNYSERIGSVRPAYCTAIGRVLLAELSGPDLDRYFKATTIAPHTKSTLVSEQEIRNEIAKAKASGAAYDDQEFNNEIRCIAAPVRNYAGKVVAAIGISGPIWRINARDVPRLTEKVKAGARRLSAELGFAEGGAEEFDPASGRGRAALSDVRS